MEKQYRKVTKSWLEKVQSNVMLLEDEVDGLGKD